MCMLHITLLTTCSRATQYLRWDNASAQRVPNFDDLCTFFRPLNNYFFQVDVYAVYWFCNMIGWFPSDYIRLVGWNRTPSNSHSTSNWVWSDFQLSVYMIRFCLIKLIWPGKSPITYKLSQYWLHWSVKWQYCKFHVKCLITLV